LGRTRAPTRSSRKTLASRAPTTCPTPTSKGVGPRAAFEERALTTLRSRSSPSLASALPSFLSATPMLSLDPLSLPARSPNGRVRGPRSRAAGAPLNFSAMPAHDPDVSTDSSASSTGPSSRFRMRAMKSTRGVSARSVCAGAANDSAKTSSGMSRPAS
jgi:hypothetical protein